MKALKSPMCSRPDLRLLWEATTWYTRQRWGYPASSCAYYTVGFILYRIRGLYVVRYIPSHTVFSSVGPDPLVTIGTRAFTLAAKRLLEWVCQCHIVKVNARC